MNKETETDVLVIGGGGAGLRAAIAAADCGVKVLLASKLPIGEAGATAYPIAEMAGYNAGDIFVPGDTKTHYIDIMKAAQEMADPKLAAIIAANAPETITQLEKWGVMFDHIGQDYYIFKSCFSNQARTHVIKGHGTPIISAMKKQVEKRKKNIKILDDIHILCLLKEKNEVFGAIGIQHGELLEIRASAVVMASGGNGRAFERNMNPVDVTGGGYAMAYEAGAELINMEFMQIGMGFSWPVVNIFNGYIWEGRPKLTDRNGNDIFENMLPSGLTSSDVMHEHRKHFPFSSSDCSQYLEIAVQRAINEGRGTEHGGVSIDLSGMTEDYVQTLEDDCGIHHMWPIVRDYMKNKGVDLLEDPVEVAVYAHAINGGIRIDENAMSSVKGLFAAGECAGGPHGADRLGGNMIVSCQVFGKIAGTKAAEFSLRKEKYGKNLHVPEEVGKLLYKNIDLNRIKTDIQKATQQYLLVDREEQGLVLLENLAVQLKREIIQAPMGEMNEENLNVYYMLTTVAIMARSARMRKESRGSHQRRDFPQKDERYNAPIIVKK